jgi:phosphate transport system protein
VGAVRAVYTGELEQLRLQVELMSLKVDEAIRRTNEVMVSGDHELARSILEGDDEIDGMLVSLTERCYDLLVRQAPVAGDLRLVVSVLRILIDLERAGDLCLRVVKVLPDRELIASHEETFPILLSMGREAERLFRIATEAWAAQDLRRALTLEDRDDVMDDAYARLTAAVLTMRGPDAVHAAVQTIAVGRAYERMADHAVMIAERMRYMLTGDTGSLSKEVGP